MKQEDIQAALEAIGKCGIKVAGDLVIEKHVEYEVDNVEDGGIGIQIMNGQRVEDSVAKGKGGRPKKVGKTNNKAFVYYAEEETNRRLQLLLTGLISLGWIREDTQLKDFLSIFSGKDTEARVVWTGDINTLTALFKELVNIKGYVKLPKGESIWVMVNARFGDNAVHKEFGNKRLGSTRPPIDNKEQIDMLVKILNPGVSIDKLKEMMQRQ